MLQYCCIVKLSQAKATPGDRFVDRTNRKYRFPDCRKRSRIAICGQVYWEPFVKVFEVTPLCCRLVPFDLLKVTMKPSASWLALASVTTALLLPSDLLGLSHAEEPSLPDPGKYPKLPSIGSTNTGPIPESPWRVHDVFRPRPPLVAPGQIDLSKGHGTSAPSDAIVLFDGTDLSHWAHLKGSAEMYQPRWKVEDGFMEVVRGTGSLYTVDTFSSCQLHIEWASPQEVRGNGQGRGNSGVKFYGLYEVQVLDSFDNFTYADGQAGAIYGQFPPEVNASRPPGEWQTFDIVFKAPEFENEKMVKPAVVTVFHNGVVVQHARELHGVARAGRSPVYGSHASHGHIMLQDHGDPVRFRNIWVRRL